MSKKDFDWNDDMDFESLADESEMTADYGDSETNFSDFNDLGDYADSPPAEGESAEAATDPGPEENVSAGEDTLEQESPVAQPSVGGPMVGTDKNPLSPAGLGFLVGACTLVGAAGLGGALLVVSGISLSELWNPAGLMSFDRIINFQEYPINLVYLVTLAVAVLTILGSALASSLAKKANQRVQASEDMLGRITALRLDDELPWSSDAFKADADTSSFVSEILGAWRLQQARQLRSVGLEGELRRLEKGLRDESRAEIADRYDHPLVGSLADAMVSWYDDRDRATKETAAIREKDELDSTEIMNFIEEARSWNQGHRQGVEIQGATLRRWSGKFDELVKKFESMTTESEAMAGLHGLQKDLARAVEKDSSESMASLDELVDRGSKLAFQIAMEVARLGPRGERLLPMSQSLEELTTQFRQSVAKAKSGGADGSTSSQAVLTRLEQLSVQLSKEGADGSAPVLRTLKDFVPAATKVAENLEEVSGGFSQQDQRLNSLGSSFSGMSGLEFNPDQVEAPSTDSSIAGGLGITQADPFGKETQVPENHPEVDPFGAGNIDLPEEEAPLAGAGFTGNQDQDTFDNDLDVQSFSGANAFATDSVSVDSEPVSEPALPVEEEKVYDLAEFGAVRIDQVNDPVASTAEDDVCAGEDESERIYELAEFGAVALN